MPSLETIKAIIQFGFMTVFAGMALTILYKYIVKKLFLDEDTIRKQRAINDKIDNEELMESRKMIKDTQKYLENHFEDFKEMGFDRVNVWRHHNGKREGQFHFLYYSLISEVVNSGLQLFSQHGINTQDNLYYQFAEYEERAIGVLPHLGQLHELGKTAHTIGKDLGTKTIYIRAITNAEDQVKGILFLSSVYGTVTEVDKKIMDEHVNKINIIFN